MRIPSKQQDAGQSLTAPSEQFTEICIVADDHPIFSARSRHHLGIGSAEKPNRANVNPVMTAIDEQRGHARAKALVDEESHALALSGSERSRTASAANCKACLMPRHRAAGSLG